MFTFSRVCVAAVLLMAACTEPSASPATATAPDAASAPAPTPEATPALMPTPAPTSEPTPQPTPEPTPVPTTEDPDLAPPTSIKAIDVQVSSLLLTWEPGADAEAYRVYVNDELVADNVMGTAYQVENLKRGNRYVFMVSSLRSPDLESPRSKRVTVNFF